MVTQQDVGEAGLEPRPAAPAAHTALSAVSRPQTVAECVLYYYLTKKNENYKSLVRRSYRRRGKSQVRAGRPWALGRCPAWAPSIRSPSGGWDTLWRPVAVPSSRQQSWEKWPFLSPEILELGVVTRRPRGSQAAFSERGLGLPRLMWAGPRTSRLKDVNSFCVLVFMRI